MRFLPPDPRAEEPYRVTPQMALRIATLGLVALTCFAVLLFRLWALQVISGDQYLQEARNNQIRTFRASAPRGSILDRRGRVLVSNVAGTLVQLWPASIEGMGRERREAMLRRLGRLLNVPYREIAGRVRAGTVDPLTPVTVKSAVHDDKVAYLLEHRAEFPGVAISETHLRRYEHGELAAHLFGSVGEIDADGLARLADEGYLLGDRVGESGVEAAYDRYLRGQAGIGQVRVDAFGNVTSERRFSQLPVAGDSLRLTIDLRLQLTAEQALRDAIRATRANGQIHANGGALVAMDPSNGELLALASYPSYDPTIFVGRRDPQKLTALGESARNDPLVNRATAGLYPPGSTFKLVTALAALEEGLLDPGELIQCTPQRVIDGQLFRNWNQRSSEPMTLATAVAVSCDTYFYEVGVRFYHAQGSPLQEWARRFGFQTLTGIDVGPEARGLVPDPAWRRRHFQTAVDRNWSSGHSVQLAIGQGDLLVTPLQMTRFYALIANGGKLVEPHLVRQIEEPAARGETPIVLRSFVPQPPRELDVDPTAIRILREGLWDATHAWYGTSVGVFGHYKVPVVGKTGTAEKYVSLPHYRGLLDQAWWCGFGPYNGPKLAVCVLIENGGHGGTAAAPAALRVFEAFFRTKAPPIVSTLTD